MTMSSRRPFIIKRRILQNDQPGKVGRVQPLRRHTSSNLVVPLVSSALMPPSSSSHFTPSRSLQKRSIYRRTKRVQIYPKVTYVDDVELGRDPNWEFSFKTPTECSDRLTSSPIKQSKVTSMDKAHQSVLDLSPIRKPRNLTVCPGYDHTPHSFSHSPVTCPYGGFTVDRPHAGESTNMSCLVTDELFLDAVNDSLVEKFQDIKFCCLDDNISNISNTSASQFFPEHQ